MWDQNLKHGFGIFTFQDGVQYNGRFYNDRMIESNVHGFSVPNGLTKIGNEMISTANSKLGNKGKNSIGRLVTIANKQKEKEDLNDNDNQKFNEKEDSKTRYSTANSITNKNIEIKQNNIISGLEAISEQAELINLSVIANEKQIKDNTVINNTTDSLQMANTQLLKQNQPNKRLKEYEFNVFKNLIELNLIQKLRVI